MDFGLYIPPLLFDHDCVIIPNFGGFVSNPHRARINSLTSRIEPPYKEIGFNPRLVKNDGLLAHFIHQKQGISYEEALKEISLEVEQIKSTVNSGKSYRINEIGTFYQDKNGSLRFSAARSTNFNLDFFGFESIDVQLPAPEEKPALEETKVIPITREEEEKIVPITRERKERDWKKIAIVAACVPLLGYLAWVPTHVDVNPDGRKFYLSDLNPFQKPVCPQYEVRTGQPDKISAPSMEGESIFKDLALSNENFVNTSFFEKDDPNYNEKELVTVQLRNFPAEAVSTRVQHALLPSSKTKAYYVVGGCFREYSNATNFVDKLRSEGFKAVLIDKKGSLYRVGIEGSNSRDEILNQLDRAVGAGYSDAWVLRK